MDTDWDRVAELARTERSALAAIARAEGCTPEDAIDVVQDALCTLLGLAHGGTLDVLPEEWAPYLAGIVRNAARNRRRLHAVAKPHVALDVVERAETSPDAADALLAKAEDHVRLRACVAELCEIQRAVVTLRMLEERAGEDVARSLGITPGYVAVLLLRAKASLRSCMAE